MINNGRKSSSSRSHLQEGKYHSILFQQAETPFEIVVKSESFAYHFCMNVYFESFFSMLMVVSHKMETHFSMVEKLYAEILGFLAR